MHNLWTKKQNKINPQRISFCSSFTQTTSFHFQNKLPHKSRKSHTLIFSPFPPTYTHKLQTLTLIPKGTKLLVKEKPLNVHSKMIQQQQQQEQMLQISYNTQPIMISRIQGWYRYKCLTIIFFFSLNMLSAVGSYRWPPSILVILLLLLLSLMDAIQISHNNMLMAAGTLAGHLNIINIVVVAKIWLDGCDQIFKPQRTVPSSVLEQNLWNHRNVLHILIDFKWQD